MARPWHLPPDWELAGRRQSLESTFHLSSHHARTALPPPYTPTSPVLRDDHLPQPQTNASIHSSCAALPNRCTSASSSRRPQNQTSSANSCMPSGRHASFGVIRRRRRRGVVCAMSCKHNRRLALRFIGRVLFSWGRDGRARGRAAGRHRAPKWNRPECRSARDGNIRARRAQPSGGTVGAQEWIACGVFPFENGGTGIGLWRMTCKV